MQNAAIIRQSAMDLYVFVRNFNTSDELNVASYVDLVRKEIDTFRLLFIDWVAGFDKSNYIWDEWELFNPPGAIPPNENDYNDPID